MYLAYTSIWRYVHKITFSAKVQMQTPQENMKSIKRKKKCENEVDYLQSSDIDPSKSAVDNPSFLR